MPQLPLYPDNLPLEWTITLAILLAIMITRSVMMIGTAFALINAVSFAKRRRIYRLNYADGQILRELRIALTVIGFDAVVYSTLHTARIIRPEYEINHLHGLITYVGLFIWIEIWFYVSHRLMHHPKLYWMHKHHHDSVVTTPLTSLSFSLIERAFLLAGVFAGIALVNLFWAPNLLGLVLAMMTNYFFNTWIHSNVEVFPRGFAGSRLGRWFITPSFHAMHHTRFNGHYGLYTAFLDRWFGTEFEDYEYVFERAASGDGLTRPGERRHRKARGGQATAAPAGAAQPVGKAQS
jgi:sterol desaturase/sphingolipid hydroxylase (fatty acid hydroxylase superfamily)